MEREYLGEENGSVAKYLVVNADDGFYAEKRDEGIVRCLLHPNAGASDVSVLMNGVVAKQLIKMSKPMQERCSCLFAFLRSHDLMPGLHINLTEGTPLSPGDRLSSLVDSDGYFLGKYGLRSYSSGNSDGKKVNLQQVELEIDKQLYAFRTLFGASPSHADGHQHIHVLPVIAPVVARLLPRHHVPWVRVPQEDDNIAEAETIDPESVRFYRSVSSEAKLAREIFLSSGLRCTDAFLGMTLMGSNQTVHGISRCLRRIIHSNAASVEFMAHPGYRIDRTMPIVNGIDRGGCGDRNGPDEFSCSADREHELSVLCSSDLQHVYDNMSVRLVPFQGLL